MKRLLFSSATALFLMAQAPASGWSQQYYLYAPTPVDAPKTTSSKDGVAVQEVTIQKGDTLYAISRRFSGRGSYYPQILLFNDIKNPNLIYPGEVFRIPLSKSPALSVQPAATETKATTADGLKSATTGSSQPVQAPQTKSSAHGKTTASPKKATPEKRSAPPTVQPGQLIFENAVRAYRQDDCKTAIDLFDRFLSENQNSPLAADASFYKAECYLKLSK